MKKLIFTAMFITLTVLSYGKNASRIVLTSKAEKSSGRFVKQVLSQPIKLKTETANPKCRVTCTVSVYDEMTGTYYGMSATAGSIFTSCETAAERACSKVAEKALDAFINYN